MNLNGHGCYINTNPTRFRRHAWLPLYVEKDINAAVAAMQGHQTGTSAGGDSPQPST
jgi:hypothetical protein